MRHLQVDATRLPHACGAYGNQTPQRTFDGGATFYKKLRGTHAGHTRDTRGTHMGHTWDTAFYCMPRNKGLSHCNCFCRFPRDTVKRSVPCVSHVCPTCVPRVSRVCPSSQNHRNIAIFAIKKLMEIRRYSGHSVDTQRAHSGHTVDTQWTLVNTVSRGTRQKYLRWFKTLCRAGKAIA